MAKVFFSYSHSDEALRDQIEKQLSVLKRQGLIETWHDRRIGAGSDFAKEIDARIESDDIILLLVSSDFLDSDYCYDIEMKRALERHEAGEAIVIPVILRACDWSSAPFSHLMATPPDGRPVTKFADRDEGFLEVAKAVRAAVERLATASSKGTPDKQVLIKTLAPKRPVTIDRSSNLTIAKKFSQKDCDTFKVETFEYIASYFENTLNELQSRNSGVDFTFRRIDANRFSSVIYVDGEAKARATIFMGGADRFSDGIAYVAEETLGTGSYNELLNVKSDEQSIFIESLGMASFHGRSKLTMEGAAELLWSTFIKPIQPRG